MTLRKSFAFLIVAIVMLPLTILVGVCIVLTIPLQIVAKFIDWAENELNCNDA